jgi:hypothetical protein
VRQKNVVMGSKRPGTKNACADEDSISLTDQTTLVVQQIKKGILHDS